MNKKQGVILGVLIGIVALLAILSWIFSKTWLENNDYPYYGHMLGGWGMPFGMIAMAIFWIGVIYFAFNGFKYRDEYRNDRAIEVLKSRLAKGEISIDEYEKLLERIKEK